MKRLMENTVFSGFVMACRLATCPTRISPSFVKATTDGVSRLPSWLGITVGLPPSITATTELVVPRSMPITFAMSAVLPSRSRVEHRRCRPHVWGGFGGGRRGPLRVSSLEDLDLDLARLQLFRLREHDLQHPVAVGRLDLVRLHCHRQLDQPLELAVDALHVEELLVLVLVLPTTLALDREQVAGDRHRDVLLAYARQLHPQHEVILRLVHIDGR